MPIDIRKALSAALEAATQQPQAPAPQPEPRKPRLTTGKALLVGAGVVTAGKLVAGPKAREMFDSLQQRIEAAGAEPTEDQADEDFDEEDFDDEEPEDEADEDFDDEEPEDEADEDSDEEDDEEDRRHGSESRRRRQRPRARARGRH